MQITGCYADYKTIMKKEDLRIDGYDMKYGRTLDLIKEIFPNEYETRLKALKEDEE